MRFLSGGHIELSLPGSVDPATLTLVPAGSVAWTGEPSLGRDVEVAHGTIAALFRGQHPIKIYHAANGDPVPFYGPSDPSRVNDLVFQIGDWVVKVWDYPPHDPRGHAMTDQQRRLWATHLRGHQTPDGYLILDPTPPPTKVTTTDIPDLHLTIGPTGIDILMRPCTDTERAGTPDQRGYTVHTYPTSGTWICDSAVPLVAAVYGPKQPQRDYSQHLQLSHITGPLPH